MGKVWGWGWRQETWQHLGDAYGATRTYTVTTSLPGGAGASSFPLGNTMDATALGIQGAQPARDSGYGGTTLQGTRVAAGARVLFNSEDLTRKVACKLARYLQRHTQSTVDNVSSSTSLVLTPTHCQTTAGAWNPL